MFWLFATFVTFGTPPSAKAEAEVELSIDFFYDALQPYGEWVDVEDYGYCWQPTVGLEDESWAPYTDGHWAHTDAGWTWISDEEFGWATYHYGRWVRADNRWCWVPGYEWAPAWVSWRESEEEVGWAPLPPEARWRASIGFSTWTDSYYDIGPSYYNCVPVRYFGERSMRRHIIDRSRNVNFINRSVNITNITYNNKVVNNIYVGGPSYARIEHRSEHKIPQLNLRRNDQFKSGDWDNVRHSDGKKGHSGGISRIEDNELHVATPHFSRPDKQPAPKQVKAPLLRDNVDRGWKNIGDAGEERKIRDRQDIEAKKTLPKEMADAPDRPKQVRKPIPDQKSDERKDKPNVSPKPTQNDPRPREERRKPTPQRETPDDGPNKKPGKRPEADDTPHVAPKPKMKPRDEDTRPPSPQPRPQPKADPTPAPKAKPQREPEPRPPEQPKKVAPPQAPKSNPPVQRREAPPQRQQPKAAPKPQPKPEQRAQPRPAPQPRPQQNTGPTKGKPSAEEDEDTGKKKPKKN